MAEAAQLLVQWRNAAFQPSLSNNQTLSKGRISNESPYDFTRSSAARKFSALLRKPSRSSAERSGGITAVTPAADAENPDVIARHYFKMLKRKSHWPLKCASLSQHTDIDFAVVIGGDRVRWFAITRGKAPRDFYL